MARTVVACLLLAASLAPAAFAAKAADTPESTFKAYISAVKERGFSASADFMHPDELVKFRDMLVPLFEPVDDPVTRELTRRFFGTSATPESVRELTPLEFMRGVLGAIDAQFKSVSATLGEPQVLGAVKEGDVIHLVTRSTAGAGDVQLTQMEVVSLKRSGNEWRLLLSGKMEGLAKTLRASRQRKGTGIAFRTTQEWAAALVNAIQKNWIRPRGEPPGKPCKVRVTIDAAGEVGDTRVVGSCGSTVLDQAVVAAVFRASPLPVPSDPSLFESSITINFVPD